LGVGNLLQVVYDIYYIGLPNATFRGWQTITKLLL